MGDVVQIEEDNLGLESYIRVRVNLDVNKPLRRFHNLKCKYGRVINLNSNMKGYLFSFHVWCEKECLNVSEEEQISGLRWGPRLKATLRKGRKKFIEEVEEVKSSRKYYL